MHRHHLRLLPGAARGHGIRVFRVLAVLREKWAKRGKKGLKRGKKGLKRGLKGFGVQIPKNP